MASERFLRLPREKRKAIYEAAIGEFVCVPFEKVSINKIIQKAGISRGSFYTYFEDKRELFSFVLEDTREQWRKFCLDYLKKSDGDFWGMMESVLETGMEFCKVNDMFRFYRNIIMYQEIKAVGGPTREEAMEIARNLYAQVDCSRFKEDSVEYFAMVLEQALIAVLSEIAYYYENPEAEEKIKEDYRRKMNILQYGACKAPKENQMEE